tara:strand:- start:35 stop:265 length:231 start_codon:yes stop_codon:yes gene_type:complete
MTNKRSKDWLLLNAVLAYIHNYPNNQFTEQYKKLKDELINTPKVQGRGRPAKRARKKETTSNTTSKETNQTTTKET